MKLLGRESFSIHGFVRKGKLGEKVLHAGIHPIFLKTSHPFCGLLISTTFQSPLQDLTAKLSSEGSYPEILLMCKC